MKEGQLVPEPFDFSMKNRLALEDLHSMLKSVMFPESVKATSRFNLTAGDYDFLRLYMSMVPGESTYPKYDTTEFWDNYVKFVYYGSEKTVPEKGVRIFGKTGTAYGYLSESCYFVDFDHQVEFMLTAVIYCNSDGIFNDDRYDYDSIGYPFFKNLGRTIYDYELKRTKKHRADPSRFRYNYQDQK